MTKKLLTILLLLAGSIGWAQQKPNVLFIAVDDLRPELGCYASPVAITPNMDALAKTGLLFNRAYCQEAICSPSRASVMTGAYPESIKVIENYAYFRDLNPDIITLPQQFRKHGYETVYAGKIFHPGHADEKLSWSRRPAADKVERAPGLTGGYAIEENREVTRKNKAEVVARYGEVALRDGLGSGPAYEFADLPDNAYDDGYNTEVAIATMKEMLKNGDKPFFLGLGFTKPHLNWVAPKKYWDLYQEVTIPLATHTQAPKDGAAMGVHASFELRSRYGIPKEGEINDSLARELKRAYLACVSFVDAQIGKMMAALDEAGVRENTIVVLWSDHGWHLGDMGIWGKATNYETATRVPLIISVPGMSEKSRGKKTDALVELVDMYPTLCELAGIPKPAHLEGKSFVPLLSNPKQAWQFAAFSQFPSPALREWAANPLSKGMRETYFGPLIQKVEARIQQQQKETWDREQFEQRLMGYTMRTDRYRLVVWKDTANKQAPPIYVELYDHNKDPSETKNIAAQKPELVRGLLEQFGRHWAGDKRMAAQ